MPYWTVKATWLEDEVEASSPSGTIVEKDYESVRHVIARDCVRSHHVEARLPPPTMVEAI